MLGKYELLERISAMDRGFFWTLNNQHSVCFDHPASDILRLASGSRSLKHVVEMLLKETSADPAYKNNEPIIMASICGNEGVVELLLKTGKVDVTAGDNFALIGACEKGYTNVVDLLLRHGACSFARNNLPFCKASAGGHIDVLRLLLQHGANPSVSDNLPIRLAIANYQIEVVRFLLNKGVSLDRSFLEKMMEKRDDNTRIFKRFKGFRDHELPLPKHLKRLVERNNKFYRMEKYREIIKLLE
jgi:ankyrin repeat protein